MTDRILLFLICLLTGPIGHAQVLPLPGARLNYTQVMFEYEKVKGAAMYVVQVAEDTPHSSFDHCPIEQRDPATATMISGLDFGHRYKWRYAGLIDGQAPTWRGPWQFSIDSNVLMRLRLYDLTVTTDDSAANAGGLIVNDGTFTITDRRGKIVWCLPKINWQPHAARATVVTDSSIDQVLKLEIRPVIMDLRLNPFGTITYLSDSDIVECDLDGHKLWEKHHCAPPSEMGESYYNHVFMRIPGGHYMALGGEGWRKMPAHIDSALSSKKYAWRDTFGGTEYARVDFGTVLEYDKKGDLVWSWNSEGYLDPYGSVGPMSNMALRAHINALSVDRQDKFVYVGFRDIDRIIKIEKSTGRVIDSWGEWPGAAHRLDIHRQHDATILDDGTILVFDNNDYPGTDSIPGVIIFSQTPDSGRVVWRYDYDMPPAARGLARSRGNAVLLRNGNILVCTGTVGAIFEVTKDKKIVWQASYKCKDMPGYDFSHLLYRAYPVSSLYPCYFTFTTDRDTVTKTSPEFNITIFNKGSEEDSYGVILSPAIGDETVQITHPVSPNSSQALHITLNKNFGWDHKIEMRIYSMTNPDLERKCVVWYE
jgi:outer membrane protein assembly factor BamB